GVTPGRLGREVHGVPVFDTVAQAVAHRGAPIYGSVVTVPPAFTKDAVFEAIENGIQLVVIVTERIPHATSRRWSSWRRCGVHASLDQTASASSCLTRSRWAASAGRHATQRRHIRPDRSE